MAEHLLEQHHYQDKVIRGGDRVILVDKHKRIIFWGCMVKDSYLFAELAFFAPNIKNSLVWISDIKKTQSYQIRLSKNVLCSDFEAKAQNVVFEVVSP